MRIDIKLVGKGATLHLNGRVFDLTEKDVRWLRAELNRILQKLHEKREKNG